MVAQTQNNIYMTNYVNIQNGIIVNSVSKVTKQAIINTVNGASLKLNTFHMTMFLYGAKIYVENCKEQMIDKSILELYMMLNEKIIENNPEVDFTFNNNHLMFLEQFLINRLNHCEKERDEKNNKFNPDTYISMKLMLLNIKELMLGEIVEVLTTAH